MLLEELLQNAGVIKACAELGTDISQISSDSRGVLKGGLFVCIKGTRSDGHFFIKDAVERGAAVVAVEDESSVPAGVPYVLVQSTRIAEAHIWNNWYRSPAEGMRCVAVTGTNGKTSTVFILESILREAGKKCGIITTVRVSADGKQIGTYGGSSVTDADGAMTTPDPEYLFGAVYAMKRAGVEYLIYEATSHALALCKTDPIKPDVAVFTNLTEEHLDFHGTMERYFAAKARLADMAGTLIINSDDEYFKKLGSPEGKKIVTCSADLDSGRYLSADVSALRQELSGTDGIRYFFFSDSAVFKAECPIPGRHTVYNTMLAGAAALELGIDPAAVKRGISKINGIPGRLEKVQADVPFDVFIDFAHTSDALEKLLYTVRGMMHKGKLILLFGCGGDRDRSKRRKMGAIASRLADFTVITGDNSRSEEPREIIKEIMSGFDLEKPHKVVPDRREAIAYALDIAEAGDILVLAGKGHEKYEITSNGRLPFDEAELVREIAAIKKKATDI